MRYFLDTEFIEDGKTIDLVSIAIVAEDGRELYAGRRTCKLERSDSWFKENVLPYLPPKTVCSRCNGQGVCYPSVTGRVEGDQCNQCWGWGHVCDDFWIDSKDIATRLLKFTNSEEYGDPEFWAYYADYDWVALCQLFGRMIDLPEYFPKFCMDLKQWMVQSRMPSSYRPKQENEHDALADAKWNLALFRNLERWEANKRWEDRTRLESR